MNKIYYLFFLILLYIYNVNCAATVTELLYNNGTTVFNGKPISTSSTMCTFNIPIKIEIQSTQPQTIIDVLTTIGSITNTGFNTNGSLFLGKVTATTSIGDNLVTFNITTSFTTYIIGSLFKLSCLGYSNTQFSYNVLSSGIFYNSLAYIISFNQLSTYLDFDGLPVTYKQIYMGNNNYFISLDYNDQSFFSTLQNNTLSFNMKFATTQSPIKLNIPFQYSTSDLIITSYQKESTSNLTDPLYIELNSKTINNYFSGVLNQSEKYYDQPFLINGNSIINSYTLLNPMVGDLLQATSYSLYYYKNGSNNVYNKDVNQNKINITTTVTIPTAIENSIIGIANFSIYLYNPNIPYSMSISNPKQIFRYPFGLNRPSTQFIYYSYYYKYLAQRTKATTLMFFLNDHEYEFLYSPYTTPSNNAPYLTFYNLSLIPNGKMILTLNITYSDDMLTVITLYSSPSQAYTTSHYSPILTEDPSNNTLQVQFVIDRFNLYKIVLNSEGEQTSSYFVDPTYFYKLTDPINGTVYKSLETVSSLDQLPSTFNYSTFIKNIKFLFNDLKVSNQRVSNKMYIDAPTFPKDRELKVTFIYTDSKINQKNDTVYSYYNQTSKLFEFEFNIPKNIKTGNVTYIVSLDSLNQLNYYSFSLPNNYQLRIKESSSIDTFGPIVTKVSMLFSSGVGWSITIKDDANGFNYGILIVRGSVDFTERNITINSENLILGDEYQGTYSAIFSISEPCTSQNYQIIYAYFEDSEGYSTEYDSIKVNKLNPFYKLYSNTNDLSTILGVYFTCADLVPSDGASKLPEIVAFDIASISTFKQTSETRTISFSYTAKHQNGISTFVLPKIYATFSNFRVLESYETKVIYSNATVTNFYTSLIVPYKYDSFYNIYFSIYGVVSNAGHVLGLSPLDLMKAGFSNFTVNNSFINDGCSIAGSSKYSSTGQGGLWLYGISLNIVYEYVFCYGILFDDQVTMHPSQVSSGAVYFDNIKPTIYPIRIYAYTGFDLQRSDAFFINPVIYNFTYSDPSIPENNNSSTTSLCKGAPLCGGSSQGICLSTGCKCISPWVGLDCMSQVINVPPPTINETNPSTNITVGNTEDKQFTSIISIVGIRELEINGSEANKYIFDKWEYKLLSNDSTSISYTYQSKIKKNQQDVTNITITLDWYKQSSIVNFAGETIDINPSSIKYTIEMTSYPFSNLLNTLQLIIKASIQSSENYKCHQETQFINSTIDNSDYLKLQIDDHSFYGRFIKRSIVDSLKIVSLSNTILDESVIIDNQQSLINNQNTSQSYIGINIPQFLESVIIDPDFSILLDSNSVSNCNGSSGLSKSQLAGIIVGSVCFFIILVLIVSLLIYKSPGCFGVKIFIYKLFKKSKL